MKQLWRDKDGNPLKVSEIVQHLREIAPLARYSTDIAAAWPIVEMFKERGDYKIEISAYPKDKLWTIKAYHREGYDKSCTTSAETLPLAVCLAALKTLPSGDKQEND